mmetsp:Transcript_87247/g.242005  ORF Transcript_87247/g.242005 Transcript_87247/m.242005 type:complete len:205 (-) Transcript_87247:360-974(-)
MVGARATGGCAGGRLEATGGALAGPSGPRSASNCVGKAMMVSTSPKSCRLNTSSSGGQSREPVSREQKAPRSPTPSLSAGACPGRSNMGPAVCAALFSGTSPLKTSERSSATAKWLSSKPLAPPASKAAAILRNVGSLCSSASMCCWMMFASFRSSVFTPHMRRFFAAPPFSPSFPSSSSAMSAELRPPRTLYVSVCTQSTRQA